MTIETTIRNGLPVLAIGALSRADSTVGPSGWVVDDLEVTFLSGHHIPFQLDEDDEERIVDELVQACNEPPC